MGKGIAAVGADADPRMDLRHRRGDQVFGELGISHGIFDQSGVAAGPILRVGAVEGRGAAMGRYASAVRIPALPWSILVTVPWAIAFRAASRCVGVLVP